MKIGDFVNINTEYENDHTLVQSGELDGKLYTLKSYKSGSYNSHQIEKINKEFEILNKLNSDSNYLLNVNGNQVLFFPYADGMSFSKFLRVWEFSIKKFLEIAIEVTKELQAIHDQNIIHLDLNPSNIIYDTVQNRIKIIDFGSAKQHDSKNIYLGNPERVECDLNYISPELTGRINRVVDLRSDLYSFGIILYEMVAGKKVFDSSNVMQLVHSHIAKTPNPLSNYISDFPKVLEDIIFKLISKNAEDRYQSTYGVLKDLSKCLKELLKDGEVKPFKIGAEDASIKLRISQKCYGRSDEINAMKKAFIKAKNGGKEVVFIKGSAGTGKSNLVAENHRLLSENNSIFIEGKFDQVNLNIPFSAWVQAFDNFIRFVLTETKENVEIWKERIKEGTGENLSYLCFIIPNLKWLFPEINVDSTYFTLDTQDRLKVAIKNLIKSIIEIQPLVIFIDDWQWADPVSIDLFKFLLESEDINKIMFLAAYRHNELSKHSSFLSIETEFNTSNPNAGGTVISLDKLEKVDTMEMLVDTFSFNDENLELLNELIYERTSGNPLFFSQYLQALVSENFISFNRKLKKWDWDINKLKSAILSEDIISLLINKVNKFTAEEKKLLQEASCIGNTMSMGLLAAVSSKSSKELYHLLERPLQEGMIRIDSNFSVSEEGDKIINKEIRFSHDRIQQGIYNTLSENEINNTHYQIAKILLNEYGEKDVEKNIFTLVNHLNKSSMLVEDYEEKKSIAHFNFLAAEKAKRLIDFKHGLDLTVKGLNIIDAEIITAKNYDIAMPLHLLRYEIGCHIKDETETTKWENAILDANPNKLDLIYFQRFKIKGLISKAQFASAVDYGIKILHSYGFKIRKNPSKLDLIWSFIKTSRSYNKKSVDDLIKLKRMQDPFQIQITEITMVINIAGYFSNKDLWALVISEITRYYIQNGVTALTPLAFSGYASILIVGNQDIKTGVAFGKMALKLHDELKTSISLNKSVFIYYALIDWWENPIESAIEGLEKSIVLSNNSGDLQFIGHASTLKANYLDETGAQLSFLKDATDELLSKIEGTQERIDVYLTRLRETKIDSLLNPNLLEDGISIKYYDFEKEEETHLKNNQKDVIATYYVNVGYLDYCLNKFEEAYKNIQKEELLGGNTSLGTFTYYGYHFYKTIVKYGALVYLSKSEKKSARKYCKKWLKSYKKYSEVSPANFTTRMYILQAMEFNAESKKLRALETYLKAIDASKKYDKMQYRGLAWERASEILKDLGNTETANLFFINAYQAYYNWGAVGICQRMIKQNLWLKEKVSKPDKKYTSESNQSMNALDSLDLTTVFKSSEAISSEIDKEKLLRKLILICVENAGAENGYLILQKKDEFYVSASADVNQESQLYDNIKLKDFDAICPKIINFVERTQSPLILPDACNDPIYGENPYIKEHKLKSVFSMPIINQGNLIGFIYLTNNLTRDAFTKKQVQIINMLSGQIAISIENSSLIENLEDKVRERTKEIELEKEKSDKLLLNILPRSTAKELKSTGKAVPRYYNDVSVMFIDFKNFSGISQQMDYRELVLLIDEYFRAFDDIIEKYNVEKIKTIGDAYLCVSGMPIETEGSAEQLVSSALDIQDYIVKAKAIKTESGKQYFEARIGIHSGPVISGVVGNKKFAFDIWGDTVNIAARMESSSEIGRISISDSTYQKIKNKFDCHHRGKIHAKNIGELDMYFVIAKK